MFSAHTAPAWYVVLVTTAAQMVVAMSNIVLPTIAPKVAESLAVDPVLVGYHVGLTFGAATVASIYAGLFVPRWGAALMTQLSMLFCVIGLVMFALPHIGFIGLGSVAVGAGMGFASPAAAHLLVLHTAPGRRNLMFSIKQTGVPLGGVIVSLMVPVMAVTVGWQWALATIAGIAIATLLAAERARVAWDADRQPAGSARSEPFGGIPLVWRREALRWVCLASVLFSAIQRIFLSFAVIYLVAEGGYDQPRRWRHVLLHLRRGNVRPALLHAGVRRDRQLRRDLQPDGGCGAGLAGVSVPRQPARSVRAG